jgi:hypothetical protein
MDVPHLYSGGLEMRRVIGFCIVCTITHLLLGCATNIDQRVSKSLDPGFVNSKLETRMTDLSVGGECPGTKSLKIVNGETRNEKYDIGDFRFYIVPKDLTNYIAKDIESMLIASNIKVSESLDNKIIVSFEDIKLTEGWSFGASCKIKVQIPEINYTNTYVGESGSGVVQHAVAYAIHLSIDNFLRDPVFQNYVRCHQESGSPNP